MEAVLCEEWFALRQTRLRRAWRVHRPLGVRHLPLCAFHALRICNRSLAGHFPRTGGQRLHADLYTVSGSTVNNPTGFSAVHHLLHCAVLSKDGNTLYMGCVVYDLGPGNVTVGVSNERGGLQPASVIVAAKHLNVFVWPCSALRLLLNVRPCHALTSLCSYYGMVCSGVWDFTHLHTSSQLFTTFHNFSQHNFGHIFVKNCEEL